jgi:hypothetical protein
MNTKILQICKAPKSLLAVYADGEDGKASTMPVVCLALVELRNGGTEVKPMVAMAQEGSLYLADDFTDTFIGLHMEGN